jgi:hypothetical protein
VIIKQQKSVRRSNSHPLRSIFPRQVFNMRYAAAHLERHVMKAPVLHYFWNSA